MQGKQGKPTEERLPPYVPYRTWRKLLRELSVYTPSRFDPSYFDGLKITKSSRSMLKGTLCFLGLMSSDGFPTPELHQLVKSEGEAWRVALASIVRHSYAPLFSERDVTRATQAQIREYFSSKGASGDIGRKCLSFFYAIAREANIPLSPHLRKSVPLGRGKKAGLDDTPRQRLGKLAESGRNPEWERILLDKFPNFNPEWSDELKKKWFDAFKFLKRTLDTSTSGQRPITRR